VRRLLAAIDRLNVWRLWRQAGQGPVPRHLVLVIDCKTPGRPRSRPPRPRRRRARRSDRHRNARPGDESTGDQCADAERVEDLLVWSERAAIPIVSLFLLSADSLKRLGPAELPVLISGLERHVKWLAEVSGRCGWQLRAIGRLELVPGELRRALVDASHETPATGRMLVQLAIGYGGREEIVEALKHWAARLEVTARPTLSEGLERLDPSDLTPYLYTGDAPVPDLILRAGNEANLSGSVLWHCVHSNPCFLDVIWPEFQEIDFLRALRTFQARELHIA
jgi:short-chain Z-isoprenyl diphosphate synthase